MTEPTKTTKTTKTKHCCRYPESFFLLRGNHECASLNRIYGASPPSLPSTTIDWLLGRLVGRLID
jgi:hypothetical protein